MPKYKKAENEIEIIECIKNAVNRFYKSKAYIRTVDFEEKTDDGLLKFTARLCCDAFEQDIVYYPKALFARQFIDTQFHFAASEYTYSIYDIFNLFDIDDFGLYYYTEFYSAEDAEKAVTEILETTEKYYDYIKSAQSFEYLIRLEKNYETDMINTAGSSWKECEKDELLLPENHIEFSAAGTSFKSRHINKLRRKNKKGTPSLIYEKRFLNYIESGNPPGRYTVDLGAEHNKYRLIIDSVLFIFSFFGIFVFIFLAAAHRYGVQYAAERMNYNIINCTVCALSFGGLLSVWLTKRIIQLILSKKYGKEVVADYYKKDFNALANKILAVFLSVILAGWFYICLKAVLF